MRHIVPALIALLLLLSGCSATAQSPQAVNTEPEWVELLEEAPREKPEVLMFGDLTQSMLGFSGSADSPISKTLLPLTNQARFNNWHTYLLEPDENRDLQWQECNPLLLMAAMINRNDKSSYTTTGDFDEGGPLYAVYSREADPDRVCLLITDLLEQDGQLSILYEYTAELFQAPTHQQLYIAAADSPFSGRVSFPTIVDERLVVRGIDYDGSRPFVLIAAGPAEGVTEIRKLLGETGVAFEEFLVENRRATAVSVTLEPTPALQRNILIGGLTRAHCTVDLAPIETLDSAFRYLKISADHTRDALLALQGASPQGMELVLAQPRWMQWQKVSASEETDASGGETTIPDAPDVWHWVACEAPRGAALTLAAVDSGNAIDGHDSTESGLADIEVPANATLHELRITLCGETAGNAYSLQAALVTPAKNPLASSAPFERWSIPFALYGGALADTSILQRIPDFDLLLNKLSGLDTQCSYVQVGEIRVILQNYES